MLRTNRPFKRVNFYSHHVCQAEDCCIGKKRPYNHISINLASWTPENTNLLNCVIALPPYIKLAILFPNRTTFMREVNVIKELPSPPTLYSIITLFQKAYYGMYSLEQCLAPRHIWTVDKSCDQCPDNIQGSIRAPTPDAIPQTCPICLSEMKSYIKIKECGHSFHQRCLTSWTHKSNSCPLCRRHIISCPACKNTRHLSTEIFDVVEPFNPETFNQRSESQGPWNILFYYIEQLEFNRLIVDETQGVFFITNLF